MIYETPEQLARAFHDIYERRAPEFGYETRTETRLFDPTSPNGRLMIAVCAEILEHMKIDFRTAYDLYDSADRERKELRCNHSYQPGTNLCSKCGARIVQDEEAHRRKAEDTPA